MGKKLLTMVLFFVVVPWTFATMPSSPGMWIGSDGTVKYATPFRVVVGVYFGFEAENATLDITLPDGIQLLDGKLHWKGKLSKDNNKGCGSILSVQINKPGSYEITAVFDATDSLIPKNHLTTPWRESLFLYAREDAIFQYNHRADLEQAIRDSLVYPGVETRKYNERQDSIVRAFRVKTNAQPITGTNDLADIANNAYVSFHVGFLTDTVKSHKLADHYTPIQQNLIKQHQLLYSSPNLDLVSKFLDIDFHSTISDDKLLSLSIVVKNQLSALYILDQKIIQSAEDPNSCDSLLWERVKLLKKQTAERQAIVNSAPPVTH